MRPVGNGGASARPGNVPFEQQSFDALLAGVQSPAADTAGQTAASDTAAASGKQSQSNPLNALDGAGRIENESLRNLIAQRQPSAGHPSPAENYTE